jgi:hypothetical protein
MKVSDWSAKVSDRSALEERGESTVIEGLYLGQEAASFMISWGAHGRRVRVEDRPKRLYLLAGWKMGVDDYIRALDSEIYSDAKRTKSVAACLVRVEAKFAERAGQLARAEALRTAAAQIERFSLRCKDKTEVMCQCGSDSTSDWKMNRCFGLDDKFIRGFLDGIDLSFAQEASDALWYLSFNVGQLLREIESQVPTSDPKERLLCLVVRADLALVERATAK